MSEEDKDPWRFYTAEHLWERLVEALEKREVVENKLYLYTQLVSYFIQRDDAMKRVATAETEKIKESILDNVAVINDQIESLKSHLEIKEEEYDATF
jgi:hypothetical protein